MKAFPTDILTLIMITLVTFRVTKFITLDEFPLARWTRERVDKVFGDESSMAYLFSCGWCASWWIGLVTTGVVWVTHDLEFYPLIQFVGVAFAASGITGLFFDNLVDDGSE